MIIRLIISVQQKYWRLPKRWDIGFVCVRSRSSQTQCSINNNQKNNNNAVCVYPRTVARPEYRDPFNWLATTIKWNARSHSRAQKKKNRINDDGDDDEQFLALGMAKSTGERKRNRERKGMERTKSWLVGVQITRTCCIVTLIWCSLFFLFFPNYFFSFFLFLILLIYLFASCLLRSLIASCAIA